MKVKFNRRIKPGYTVYEYDMDSLNYCTCLWFLYPIFATYAIVKELKYRLYHCLKVKGIMQTPEGGRMCLRDIEVVNRILKGRNNHGTKRAANKRKDNAQERKMPFL